MDAGGTVPSRSRLPGGTFQRCPAFCQVKVPSGSRDLLDKPATGGGCRLVLASRIPYKPSATFGAGQSY